jgi:hypothetical protein
VKVRRYRAWLYWFKFRSQCAATFSGFSKRRTCSGLSGCEISFGARSVRFGMSNSWSLCEKILIIFCRVVFQIESLLGRNMEPRNQRLDATVKANHAVVDRLDIWCVTCTVSKRKDLERMKCFTLSVLWTFSLFFKAISSIIYVSTKPAFPAVYHLRWIPVMILAMISISLWDDRFLFPSFHRHYFTSWRFLWSMFVESHISLHLKRGSRIICCRIWRLVPLLVSAPVFSALTIIWLPPAPLLE